MDIKHTHNKQSICECCTHLPVPPSASLAQLSLIKQLNLYLELEALITKNTNKNKEKNFDDGINDYDDDDYDNNNNDAEEDEDIEDEIEDVDDDDENIEDYDDSFCRNFSFENELITTTNNNNDDFKSNHDNQDYDKLNVRLGANYNNCSSNEDSLLFIENDKNHPKNCNINSVNSKLNEKFAYSYELKNTKSSSTTISTNKNYSLNDSLNNRNNSNKSNNNANLSTTNINNHYKSCDNNSSRAEEDEFDSVDENDLDYVKKMHFLNLNSKQTNKIEKLKPLLPSYLFSEILSHLTNSNTALLSSHLSGEPFIGRDWVFKEIEKAFDTQHQICVISGAAGTGKTKLAQHLFKMSSMYQNIRLKMEMNKSSEASLPASEQSDKSKVLASNLAGVNFCLCDDLRSFEPSQFLINLVWSLVNFDQLSKVNSQSISFNVYKQFLTENCNNLMSKLLNEDACKLEPEFLLKKCVLEPLEALVNTQLNSSKFSYMFILIDGLDILQDKKSSKNEPTEFTKNNLGSFILNNIDIFPKW